jgi:hypothetical protein
MWDLGVLWALSFSVLSRFPSLKGAFPALQRFTTPEINAQGSAPVYQVSSSSLHIRANDHIAPASRPRPDPAMPGTGQLSSVWRGPLADVAATLHCEFRLRQAAYIHK